MSLSVLEYAFRNFVLSIGMNKKGKERSERRKLFGERETLALVQPHISTNAFDITFKKLTILEI